MGKRPRISVVLIVKNAERDLGECLDTVRGWADEIVVVDDESTDATRQIASRYTDRVLTRRMDLEGRHRNWAAAQAVHEWVMWLDADERMTDQVRQEINTALATPNDQVVAYWVPRKNYFGTQWLRHGGWYPAPHIKLYDRRYVMWREVPWDVVHPGVDIAPGHRGVELSQPLVHYNFRDVQEFIQKVNRLSTLEAIKWHLAGRRVSLAHGLWKGCDRFWKRYVYKQGFRDGYWGFLAAVLSGFYELAAYSKFREIKERGTYLRDHARPHRP